MTEERKDHLDKKLTSINREAEERDAERRASRTGIPYIDVRKVPISVDALKLIPEAEARHAKLAALEIKRRVVAVAAYDPSSLEAQASARTLAEKHHTVKFFTASLGGLEEAWRMYRFVSDKADEITGKLEINAVEGLIARITNLDAVRAEFGNKKYTTTELFQIILAGALALGASDIHLEAEDGGQKVRYRLDGLLHDVHSGLPERSADALVSRIKLLSGLKINMHGEPQDGRFTIELSEKEVEVRVSIVPSEFGETVVMRILDPDAIAVDLDHLGLRPDDAEIVLRTLEKPNGLVLNTGPTGSGKTTTLYAFLRKLVNSETKIITVEDPIEYRIDGIEQTQTKPDVGYTFASGLRAILRQDPDVILIGEIRDLETADIALQASLTGHIVFSTLHTNDAVGAVPRLVDLGAKAATIGPALALIIAQRLVRRLCLSCRTKQDISPELSKKISAFLEQLPSRVARDTYKEPQLFTAVGCAACNGLGYRGRLGIFEFLEAGQKFEAALAHDASSLGIRAFAREQEMVTMQEDGVLKVFIGQTSFDEVQTATGRIEWL